MNTGEAPTIDPDDSFNKHRLDNVRNLKFNQIQDPFSVQNCSWDGNEDGLDGCIPNPSDAYKLFGTENKVPSKSFSIYLTCTPPIKKDQKAKTTVLSADGPSMVD